MSAEGVHRPQYANSSATSLSALRLFHGSVLAISLDWRLANRGYRGVVVARRAKDAKKKINHLDVRLFTGPYHISFHFENEVRAHEALPIVSALCLPSLRCRG